MFFFSSGRSGGGCQVSARTRVWRSWLFTESLFSRIT
jgi:hypothetical protein